MMSHRSLIFRVGPVTDHSRLPAEREILPPRQAPAGEPMDTRGLGPQPSSAAVSAAVHRGRVFNPHAAFVLTSLKENRDRVSMNTLGEP